MLFPALRTGFLKAPSGAPPVTTEWISASRHFLMNFDDEARRIVTADGYDEVSDVTGNGAKFEGYDPDPTQWPDQQTLTNTRDAAMFNGTTQHMWSSGIGDSVWSAKRGRTFYALFRGHSANPSGDQTILGHQQWGSLNGLIEYGINSAGRPFIRSQAWDGTVVTLAAQSGTFDKSGDNLFGYTVNADGTVLFSHNGAMLTAPSGTIHDEGSGWGGDWNTTLGFRGWSAGNQQLFQGGLYMVALYNAAHLAADHLAQWQASQAFLGTTPGETTEWISENRAALFDFSDETRRTVVETTVYNDIDAFEASSNMRFRSSGSDLPSRPALWTQGNRSGAWFDGINDFMWGDSIDDVGNAVLEYMQVNKRTARTFYVLFRGIAGNPAARMALLDCNRWTDLNNSLQFGLNTAGRPYIISRSTGGVETILDAQSGTFSKNADNLVGFTIKADGTVAFSLNGVMLTAPAGNVHDEVMSGVDGVAILGRRAYAGGTSAHFQGGVYAVLFYNAAHDATAHATQWSAAQDFLGVSAPPPPPPAETLSLNPINPGSYVVATAGTPVDWTTTVTSTGLTQFQYAVFTSSNVARGAWVTQNTGGSLSITVTFEAHGDYLVVRKVNDDSLRAFSNAVTISVQQSGSGTADPPAGWVVDVTDHFDGTSLDTSKWQHTSFGGSAHGGAAQWDGGAGISVHDSVNELKVYRSGGVWMTTGWLQGVSLTPGEYGYHPGYGEFHVRVRARWSPAYAPGIGAYILMWTAGSQSQFSEYDILEMPTAETGGWKTVSDTTVHWRWDSAELHDYSAAKMRDVDLSQWHTWDFRRHIYTVNGEPRASLFCWVDGVEVTDDTGNRPWRWDDNEQSVDRVVFGPATYVGSEEGWYNAPRGDTPNEGSLYIDYVTIWVPPEGGGGEPPPPSRSLSISPTNPGTLQEAAPGAGAQWTTTVTSTGISAISWVVVETGTWIWRTGATTVNTTGSVDITPTFMATGDFLLVMDANDNTYQIYSGEVTIQPAPGGGGGTPAPAVHIIGRGQSNMEVMGASGWVDGAWWMVADLVSALTGIPDVVSHLDTDDADGAYTVASGTGLYTFNASEAWDPWIEARGYNQSDPSSWPLVFHGLGFQQYVQNYVASDGRSGVPVLLVEGHTEYPQYMSEAEAAVWQAAHTNFLDRYRSWVGKSVALTPIFLLHIPYSYGNWTAVDAIRASMAAQIGNAARNTHRGAGWLGDTSGDGAHWDGPGNAVAARRIGFALSRWLYDRGYAHNDLSWLPRNGPSIANIARTSNADRIRVNVTHDKGTDIIVPASPDLAAFRLVDTTGTMQPSGAARVSTTAFDLTFPRTITGSNAQVTFDFGAWPGHGGIDSAVTDNWHTGAVSKPSGAWTGNAQFNAVRFPLNATLASLNLTG